MSRGDRTECVVCGLGFPPEDTTDLDGRPHCPRCFALQAPSTLKRPPPGSTDGPSDSGAGTGPSPSPTTLRARVSASVRRWAVGRSWWIRAPVLLWMVWILVHYWNAPWYSTLWQGIDLVFHEMGHILWSPLGEFMGFAGGTLTQLLVPVAAGVVLLRQRDWFGVSVAVCWLGINCFEIVEYAGDALARQIPLVSPTVAEPEHDWTYMLAELGILHQTDAVAAAWLWAGRIIMTAGVVFGAWVLWVMWSGRELEAGGQSPEATVSRFEPRV